MCLLQCSGCLSAGCCAGEERVVVARVKKGWLLLCARILVAAM